MNSLARPRWWQLLLLVVALAAGLGWMRLARPPLPPGNLEGSTLGGPFRLTDQNGHAVQDTDFAGKYRLVYFGYSFCPDIFPNDLAAVARDVARAKTESEMIAGCAALIPERRIPPNPFNAAKVYLAVMDEHARPYRWMFPGRVGAAVR